jgi:hypothetical protein
VARYGNSYYGASKYGVAPKVAYSVEPIRTVALDFQQLKLYWENPTGNFSRIILVRNQSGFPETSEDGVVIWDEFATEGTVTRNFFTDGVDNPFDIPLIPGRPVYYRFFLFTDQKLWLDAGSIEDVVPKNTGLHDTFMNNLPKVFTSADANPLGLVDTESFLYKFMEGFTFTYEQLLTQINLLNPDSTGKYLTSSLLRLRQAQVGVTSEAGIPLKNQKRLIREILYLYSTKGTETALAAYVEALTGYPPTITVSPNLLLTVQDSTFYKSLGNWVFTNGTATSSTEQVPATGSNVIDSTYACKIVASVGFTMLLGQNDPIAKGSPVTEGTQYTASCKIKSPASAGNMTITIGWFDKMGAYISANTGTLVAANNTWKSMSVTATAPSGAVYAGLQISSSAAGTYYVDQVSLQEGDGTAGYYEARCADVFLDAPKTNFIKNPSFEVNYTDSWTFTGTATKTLDASVPTEGWTGTHSVKLVASSAWSYASNSSPAIPGQYYTGSIYIKSPDVISTTLTIDFLDDSNAVVHTLSTPYVVSTSWSRVSMPHFLPLDSLATKMVFKVAGTAGTFYLDMAQLERSYKESEYFDGSMHSDYGTVWGGTANNSYSYKYPSKTWKVTRVVDTLYEWLPRNMAWRVLTQGGVEGSGITS